jgi:hypothetical protein
VNSLQIAIAAVPLGVYFLLMGSMLLRTRPLVTSGWRDFLTLGIACAGLVAIGPMQLFFPTHAASRWPGWVWLPMFGLYLLALLILAMWGRPRLIAYGMSKAQFQDLLLEAAKEVDPNASWFGEVLSMPSSGLQLSAESTLGNHVNSVGVVGTLQNITDWIKLEKQFVHLSSKAKCSPSRSGWLLVLAGLILLTTLSPLFQNPTMAMNELRNLLLR